MREMAAPVTIAAAVEGDVDEAVARRLMLDAGAGPGTIYGKNGKAAVETRWRPAVAAARSESLRRARACLARLVAEGA